MSLLTADDVRLRPSHDIGDLASVLDDVVPGSGQEGVRDRMRDFLDRHPDALWRHCLDGHFTGSAVVVDAPAARVLLLFHAKHRRWLQPGGHADGDANLAGVALREATEETGIAGLRIAPAPLDLDIHAIPARPGEPAHLHLDLRFLVVAPLGAEPTGNHESDGLGWFTPRDLSGLDLDEGTLRLLGRGLVLGRRLVRSG